MLFTNPLGAKDHLEGSSEGHFLWVLVATDSGEPVSFWIERFLGKPDAGQGVST